MDLEDFFAVVESAAGVVAGVEASAVSALWDLEDFLAVEVAVAAAVESPASVLADLEVFLAVLDAVESVAAVSAFVLFVDFFVVEVSAD